MTAASSSSADTSDDGRSECTVTQCSFRRDETAGKESPLLLPPEAPLGGAKFSPPAAAAAAADVADVTAAFQSVSLLEASERAPLGGSGVQIQRKGEVM